MMLSWAFALWVGFVTLAQAPAPPASELTAAKALYASGAYEEALTKLSGVRAAEEIDEADQYRALCLLALGRTAETEKSLEALILRRPTFTMSDADVSPRLVTMFRVIRRRLLPEAARALYARAKGRFDQKDFPASAADLETLQRVLTDEDLDASAPAMADLSLLADGFLRLAETEIAAAAKAAAPAQPAQAVAPADLRVTEAMPAPPRDLRVYSIADAGVTPPVEVVRTVPAWRPPNPILAAREHRGILRILINEEGRVESASLVRPITESYDSLLLSSAKQWRFQPATKDGAAVRYSKDIPIVLAPVGR